MQLPSIDQNVCGQWNQVEVGYYNKLSFYLEQFTCDYRKRWAKWPNMFKNKIRWTPNMGDTQRRVGQEWSPVIRQESHPTLLSEVPTTDVNFTRERKHDVKLYRHRFQTREFWFLPEFQDFLKHLDHEYEDLQKQITCYEDFFYRTRVFHMSPYVWVCGVGLVDAITGIPNTSGTAGKTDAWLASIFEGNTPGVANPGAVGQFTMNEAFRIGQAVRNRIGMTPYTGSDGPKDNYGIDAQYKLLVDEEVYYQLTADAWVTGMKTDSFDIVNKLFEGKLFGRVHVDFERYPLRWKTTGTTSLTVSRPDPEIVINSDTDINDNRTAPNPSYAVDAQFGCAFWFGGPSYSVLESGPPPNKFGMNWNGKPKWTDEFIVYCKNSDNAAVPELAKTWGEHLRAQAQLAMGIAPDNPHNVLPIIYQRPIVSTGT